MTLPETPYSRRKVIPDIEAMSPRVPDESTLFQALPAVDVAAQADDKHPVGYNVRPNVDYGKLLTQVKAMGGCRAMLFQMDASALHRLHDFKPLVDTLIWRPNEWDSEEIFKQTKFTDIHGVEHNGAAEWVVNRQNEMINAGFAHTELWLHLHNESHLPDEVIAWEVDAINRGVNKDRPATSMKFVAINESVGNPNEHQIHRTEQIIRLAATYPNNVMIGIHDGYFSVWGNRKPVWYLDRWQHEFEEGHSYESYRESLELGPVRYVVTEAGGEDIADDHTYTDTLPRTGGRKHVGPVHANEEAWKRDYQDYTGRAYPGKDTAYLEQLTVAYEVGKWGDERIAGVCLFSWGAGGGEWSDYDVANEGSFLTQLADWKPMVAQPNPTPPPLDLPAAANPVWDVAGVDGVLSTEAGSANLRGSANASGTIRVPGGIPNGTLLKYIVPSPLILASGYQWLFVKHGDITGYMALTQATVGQQFTPPPDPPIEEPPVEDDDTQPAPPVTDHVHTADFVKVLKSQYKAMTLYNDNLKAQMEALDLQAQQAQSSLLELEALIEAYAPKEAA